DRFPGLPYIEPIPSLLFSHSFTKDICMSRFKKLAAPCAVILVTVLLTNDGHSDDPVQELPAAAPREVFVDSLVFKRNKYADEYGDRHPVVQSLDAEIAAVKKSMRSKAMSQKDDPLRKISTSSIEDMNDEELRNVVAVLIKRVLTLEEEVQILKRPQPKHYLLK
ncbi:MAG: hypothetical protein AB8B91_12465, partial [Rubripirellula sp.]